jgi:hypothetical protein
MSKKSCAVSFRIIYTVDTHTGLLQHQLKRRNGQLTINGLIEPGDNGFYTCIARNKAGSLNNTILLEVIGMHLMLFCENNLNQTSHLT